MLSGLKNVIQNCELCNLYQNFLSKESVYKHIKYPNYRQGAGIFEISSNYYLIFVDHCSGYLETDKLLDMIFNAVINKYDQHFSRHGIPKILITDNSKQFRSLEFVKFAKK